MIQKFRKSPVIIEAVLWNGDNRTEVELFVGKQLDCSTPPCNMHHGVDDIPNGSYIITIPTLEGDMKATRGDFIIKGVKGEFYPCKPDIFHLTYEPA